MSTATCDGDGATLSELFDVLRHPYRRRILATMLEVSPDALRIDPALVAPDEDPRRVASELHHNHLPTLADVGYVDWDRREDTVTPGPHFPDIVPTLELFQCHAEDLPADWP